MLEGTMINNVGLAALSTNKDNGETAETEDTVTIGDSGEYGESSAAMSEEESA